MNSQDQQYGHFSHILGKVLKSAGSPMQPAFRAMMEERFGCDFSRVRLHSGRNAAIAARFLKANAFAVGTQIVFGEDRCNFGTAEGLWLLAHELVHVIQQMRGRRPLPKPSIGSFSLERQANLAADLIASGRPLPPGFSISAASFDMIQCHQDQPCPGTKLSAQEKSMSLGANQAIEFAYKEAHARHANAILVGSDFDGNVRDVLLPVGAPNRAFGNAFLAE